MLAEPSAPPSCARRSTFSVGFYTAVNKILQQERQLEAMRRFCFSRRLAAQRLEGRLDEAFKAGIKAFTDAGFQFGDPEEWFHAPGHPHTYKPDFTNCCHCTPPVQGECMLLRIGENGRMRVEKASDIVRRAKSDQANRMTNQVRSGLRRMSQVAEQTTRRLSTVGVSMSACESSEASLRRGSNASNKGGADVAVTSTSST